MRNVLLVTLVAGSLALGGCKTTHAPGTLNLTEAELLDANNCKSSGVGNPNKYRPLVCVSIDKGGVSVDPVLITAHRKNANGNPNKLRFLSRDNDEYDIVFTQTDCMNQARMKCLEACAFDVSQTTPDQKECEYSVQLTRVLDGRTIIIRLDPIVIIDTN